MKIRKMKAADLKECVKFFSAAYSQPPYNEKWQGNNALLYLKDKFTKGFNSSYVLEDKGRIIAFAICSLSYWTNGRQAILEEIVVLPELQGKGLGKKLANYVLKELKKLKVKSVSLWSKKKSPAYRFHSKNGFAEHGGFVVMFKNY